MGEDIESGHDHFNLEIIELPRIIDDEADRSECPFESIPKIKYRSTESSPHREDLGLSKLNAIRNTIDSLEASLTLSRGLETEQWLRYSSLKTENASLSDELKEADKRNKNMLNLFRQNVRDFDFGVVGELPQNLRREVQRTWHKKYDALLKLNEQLKSEISLKDIIFEEKSKQIEVLEQRLLNLAETLIQREETVKSICTKYLTLKKRKNEQEVLLRGSIEALQDALQKANTSVNLVNSEMTLIPSKEALLARETRRSDRLARENSLLRGFLQEAKQECKCLKSPRGSSPDSFSAQN